MLTLFQFVTLDSVATIYTPLIELQPWLMIYFGALLLIISIALMNVVTAVLVEATIDRSNADKEMERLHMKAKVKAIIPGILEAFKAVDEDSNGIISREEIDVCWQRLPKDFIETVPVDSLKELFDMLDIDGSG